MHGESIGTITLDFSDIERSMSITLRRLISHKGAELDDILLFNSNRKPYMRRSMTLSH